MADEQEKRGMTIVEGLKKLRVLEKRAESTTVAISEYSSKVSTEKPAFGSDAEQRQEVSGRVQANLDLVEDMLKLKRRIDTTNLAVELKIGGQTRSIADWLLIKRKLGGIILGTIMALSTRTGDRRRMEMRGSSMGPDNAPVHVERMYDEAVKNKQLREWQDRLAEIDGRLEVVNATTPLLD